MRKEDNAKDSNTYINFHVGAIYFLFLLLLDYLGWNIFKKKRKKSDKQGIQGDKQTKSKYDAPFSWSYSFGGRQNFFFVDRIKSCIYFSLFNFNKTSFI